MQLWKRGPGIFTVLALVMLACNLALNLVPIVGIVLAQLLLPLLECGLLYACLAADRGDRPRLRHLIGVAAAPPRALLAVIAASLVIFAVETIVAQLLGDVNMITTAGKDADAMTPGVLIATYAAGIAASLPVMFVPFVALFDGAGVRPAFAQSIAAFARNPSPSGSRSRPRTFVPGHGRAGSRHQCGWSSERSARLTSNQFGQLRSISGPVTVTERNLCQ